MKYFRDQNFKYLDVRWVSGDMTHECHTRSTALYTYACLDQLLTVSVNFKLNEHIQIFYKARLHVHGHVPAQEE